MDFKTIDVIETLLYLRNNPLPDNIEDRAAILDNLYKDEIFFVYYDNVIKYSNSFKETYSIEYIKGLLRKGNIYGRDLDTELNNSILNDEERLLVRFFLKGR